MQIWKRNLYIMFVAQFFSAIAFAVMFPFLPRYVNSLNSIFGLNKTFLIGAVYSAQAITTTIFSPIWGALADRFGKKLMLLRSLFAGAMVMLLIAFADSAEMLLLLRAIQGMITGVAAASNALVASVVPKERSGYAMGVMSVAVLLGVSIGPLLGGIVADSYGYKVAFFLTASLLFFAALLVLFGIKAKDSTKVEENKKIRIIKDWKALFSAKAVSLLYFLRFLSWLGRTTIVPYLPLFLATIVLDEKRLNTATGLLLAVSAATATLSSIYFGRLGDRIGHKKVLIFSSAFVAAAFLPQYWIESYFGLLVFQALAGVFLGGVLPTISALLNKLIKQGEEGSAYGFDSSIIALARALSPMFGALIVFLGGFRMIFIFTAVLFIFTSILAYWKLPETKK